MYVVNAVQSGKNVGEVVATDGVVEVRPDDIFEERGNVEANSATSDDSGKVGDRVTLTPLVAAA